jgi:LmbE family N-acetylglucosaminyl deacetylase
MPVDEAARPLVALMERYRPQVVVTYDANGFYGHPDHIQAHRITVAAAEQTRIPDKVYFPVIPKSSFGRFGELLDAAGIERPQGPAGEELDIGTDDELVTTVIDCRGAVERQFRALEAHRSQTDNTFFLQLGLDLFGQLFAQEHFVRHFDRTGAATPEHDLFAGLR